MAWPALRSESPLPDQLDRLRAALGTSYRLEEKVGAGGMASVYRATDLRHDRVVAVKVLHPELASSVSSERFTAEVRLTASLQHPHILPMHDSGGEDDLLYYVMPFVEGAQTLRTRLEKATRLPIEEESMELAITVGRTRLRPQARSHPPRVEGIARKQLIHPS